MLDLDGIKDGRIEYYKKDIDDPYTVNGFNGTWAITDHRRIPEVLRDFLQFHFGVIRLSRIKIEKINEALNEIWEGPGSLEKVFNKHRELQQSGKDVKIMASDIAKIVAEDEDDQPVADATPGLTI